MSDEAKNEELKEENATEQQEQEEQKEAEPSAEEKIAALQKEVEDLKTQMLYKEADFQNFRKRSIKEKQEVYDYGNAGLLGDLLGSLDNFDLALQSAQNATDIKSIVDGISMVKNGLVSMLENKYNLTSFGVVGDPFDPNLHEAIGRIESDEVTEPSLAEIYLKGYMLKDRVIRHAKVMVKIPAEKTAEQKESEE